jgi:8-oxo-dGTP pyrophosphatase MutT (NUDIX family)
MPTPDFILNLRKKIGHQLLFIPGVTALVFNATGEVLLGKRSDTGRWAVIGGIIDPGEQPAAAAIREVMEETGVQIEIERVSGVYTSPVITYPNGDVAQYVITAFRCRPIAGEPRPNDEESLEIRYFPLTDLPEDLKEDHLLRILHAAEPANAPAAFIHDRTDEEGED